MNQITVKGKEYKIKEMNRAELGALKVEILDSMRAIKLQLEKDREIRDAGELSHFDSDWRRRARAALRFYQKALSRVTLEQSKRKAEYNNSFEKRFVTAARELLEPDMFDRLIDAARDHAQREEVEAYNEPQRVSAWATI